MQERDREVYVCSEQEAVGKLVDMLSLINSVEVPELKERLEFRYKGGIKEPAISCSKAAEEIHQLLLGVVAVVNDDIDYN